MDLRGHKISASRGAPKPNATPLIPYSNMNGATALILLYGKSLRDPQGLRSKNFIFAPESELYISRTKRSTPMDFCSF